MSSARSRLRTTRCRWSARTGARVKPQLPITAEVTPCQHELRAGGVPEHLGVHVGVAVDEARGDDVALGVDLPPPRSVIRPTAAIRSPATPTSARKEPRPDPSTTVPLRITMS